MKITTTILLTICLCLGVKWTVAQNYTVVDSILPQELAGYLAGPGSVVSNVVYKGAAIASGKFYGISNMGIDSGIILTTGRAMLSKGPNNASGAGSDNHTAGDSTLMQLAGESTHDACILEFDFIPQANIIEIQYVFGSEEYPEYVGSINDIMGIFLTGPGIQGSFNVTGYPDGGRNIAHVPETSPPWYVGINTINGSTNNQWYVSNYGNYIQYDGFTTVLVARHPVIPCETYHIKIAIADAFDGILDSGMFLKAGSLTSVGL